MKIELEKIETGFKGGCCFTHARGVALPDGGALITTQPLLLSGSDVFYGIHTLQKMPGADWSPIIPSKTLVRRKINDGAEQAVCDCTPFYHRKSGKLLLLGHTVSYTDDSSPAVMPRYTSWSVFDFSAGEWSPYKTLDMGDPDRWFSAGNGSGQSLELPDGDLLIPFYFMNREEAGNMWHNCFKSAVMRCSFDGNDLQLKEIGSPLTVDVPRGLCEPSIIFFKGRYFLALRNDQHGYIARGSDGLNYEKTVLLTFDDGADAGNYCTQQHWIVCGGKLYLVYTRRGADNDHVFRHRAPLFIAEYDPEKMCLIRATETIAVPERGARLGNFGCHRVNDNESWIVAAEWMQPDWKVCMQYGSRNTIFIAKIRCDG